MPTFLPAIDDAELHRVAQKYDASGRVRVEPVLRDAEAAELATSLGAEAPWQRVLNQDDKVWDLDHAQLAAMGPDRNAALIDAVHAQARHGFQFHYDSIRVAEDGTERKKRGLLVDKLIDAFNGPEWLKAFRHITGVPEIRMVDGQATQYLPGHFLTSHDDAVAGKNRVAAYVLSLTPGWRIEWGGLLQFHDGDGDVGLALAPRFNAMHLLRVPQVHSVSFVAPYAGTPRVSVTGWLRA